MKRKFSLKDLQGDEGPFSSGIPDAVVEAAEARAREIRERDAALDAPIGMGPGPETAASSAPPVTGPEAPTHINPETAPTHINPETAPATGSATGPEAGSGIRAVDPAAAGPVAASWSARDRVRSMIHQLRDAEVGVMTCADDPADAAPHPRSRAQDAAIREARLSALGVPSRPWTWPSFMAWPPHDVLERLEDDSLDPEARKAMVEELIALERRIRERSIQIIDWLQKHNPDEHTGDRRVLPQVSDILPDQSLSGVDPCYGIRWATLLNPSPAGLAITSSVVCWSRTSARTADGGLVRVSDRAISFGLAEQNPVARFFSEKKTTPEAIRLGIEEARNRGWGHVAMSGSHEFGMMAIRIAREKGISATITYRGTGVNYWRSYTVKVMPGLPAPDVPGQDPARQPGTATPVAVQGPSGKVPETAHRTDAFGRSVRPDGGEPGPSIH